MTLRAELADKPALSGTRQILAFNWPQYVAAAVVIILGVYLASRPIPLLARVFAIIAAVLGSWWSIASVAASWWIYDHSLLTDWSWLHATVEKPKSWVNIHAGFDDTSEPLQRVFGNAEGTVVDIYDSGDITEPSVHRARQRSLVTSETLRGRADHLPVAGDSQDAVFLLFAAHELRRRPSRLLLFGEVQRVLRRGGRLVIVEHLRDLPNFVAFGPGFRHFLPDRTWREDPAHAQLEAVACFKVTPFVTTYVWRKPP